VQDAFLVANGDGVKADATDKVALATGQPDEGAGGCAEIDRPSREASILDLIAD